MNTSITEPEPVFMQHPKLKQFSPPQHPLQVRPTDVVQGQIAACPIAATMVATAHARPDRIRAILGSPQTGDVFSKREHDKIFRFWSKVTYRVQFRRGPKNLVTPVFYVDDQTVVYAATLSGPGWPSLIEKAYAIWRGRNSYNGLQNSTSLRPVPDAQTVLHDFVGPADLADITGHRFFPHGHNDRPLTDSDLITMARRGRRRPTIAASLTQGTTNGIVSDHAYAVLRFHNDKVVLRNPWGGAGAQRSLTIAQLRANFKAILQAP